MTTVDPDAPLHPVVPGYEVSSVLGGGGFAVVYRARQVSMHRDVALKVLKDTLTDDKALSLFERECRAAGSLSWHPHVVPVFDAGRTEAGRPYLAMELLPDGSLADVVRRSGAVPPAVAARHVADIAAALGAAHELGLLHRDVKPENILVDRMGRARLADFGIVRLSGAGTTTTGTVMGTLAYMAPELLKGGRATTATDVYALGVTLATLTLGRHPYRTPGEDNPLAIIGRVLADERDLLPGDVPDDVRPIAAACLDLDPARRPDTATVARVLGDLADERPPPRRVVPVPPTPPTVVEPPAPKPKPPSPRPAPTPKPWPKPSTADDDLPFGRGVDDLYRDMDRKDRKVTRMVLSAWPFGPLVALGLGEGAAAVLDPANDLARAGLLGAGALIGLFVARLAAEGKGASFRDTGIGIVAVLGPLVQAVTLAVYGVFGSIDLLNRVGASVAVGFVLALATVTWAATSSVAPAVRATAGWLVLVFALLGAAVAFDERVGAWYMGVAQVYARGATVSLAAAVGVQLALAGVGLVGAYAIAGDE